MTTAQHPAAAEQAPEEFRTRLRAFLTEHHPGRPPRDAAGALAHQRAWAATLAGAGLAGPSWPRAYGGMELPFASQVVYQEEIARARVPSPPGTGLGIAAPTIITYATEEQKQRWLPDMLSGARVWVQGYSEPGAGSDLPALTTTARREGEHYVVTGQKVWTSRAFGADVLFALVRTGPPGSRQAGITYLVLDLDSPGVQVRMLQDMTGGSSFAEVFLDQVRVPVANRVGAEDDGWRLARTSLGHERAAGAMNQALLYRRVLDELVELARERGLLSDALLVDRLADLEARVRVLRYNAARVIDDIVEKGEPGPASSVSRLLVTTFEQEIHELAVDMLGPAGIVADRGHAVQRGRWLKGFLRTRASTIGTGTAEIQRNTVAEQVLGLPRDPAMPPR